MKKRAVNVLLLLAFCLLLGGCRESSKEAALRERAQDYVYEKYGEGFRTERSVYLVQYPRRGIPRKEKDWLFLFSDCERDFRVWYNADEDRFLDDRQAEEINAAIRAQLLEPLRERLEPCEWETEACRFGVTDELNLSLNYRAESMIGSFFHTRYDGDAAAFCREERPAPAFGCLNAVLLTPEGERAEYEARLAAFRETAQEYFSLPIYYSSVGVEAAGRRTSRITAFVYRPEDYPPRFAGSDFLAELIMDEQGARLYTPSWIEVTEGLFVTATDKNCDIELQPGDILFEPVYSAEELKALLETVPASDGKYYTTVPATAAYSPVFSPRLRSLLAETGGKLRVDFRDERGTDTRRLREISIDREKNRCYIWFVVKGAVTNLYENSYEADGNSISYYFWDQIEAMSDKTS